MAVDAATGPMAGTDRGFGPFASRAHRSRYLTTIALLIAAVVAVTLLLMSWGNEYEWFSERWWRISKMRATSIVVIATVVFAQAMATVAFQTVTNNRIITPSIMGFESLYILIQTSIVFFFGTAGLTGISPLLRFLLQVVLMVLFAVLLYSWLLSGRFGNLHVMLLVGIILGAGMGSFAIVMQQLLDPSEFDILRARLFGNVGNADTDFLPVVIPICAIAGGAIWFFGKRLDVLALGSATSTNLGMNHKRQVMLMLTLVAVLMAMSTSLVGPMTFLGFLIATLAYSVADIHDHRRILPVAWLLGYAMLGAAYFLLRHVLPLIDAVTVVIELIGGLFFLLVVLRKGRL